MTTRDPHLAAVLLACSMACAPASETASRESSLDAERADAGAGRIAIPATIRRNLGITFAEVEARRVADTIRVPGAFELRPLARREYRMALPGRVELLVDQYDRVAAGQPLFRFQSPAWPELLHEIILAEQEIDTALAEIAVGKARAEEGRRKLEVTRGRITALEEVDFRIAELEAEADGLEASLPRLEAEAALAETRLANARRTREHALHRAATAAGFSEEELAEEVGVGEDRVPTYQTLDWIEVHAMKPGVVDMLAVTDGAFVEPPAMVVSTVDPEQLRFRALALQADLPRFVEALEARIVPPRSPGRPVSEGLGATLSLGLEAHPRERTMTLLATPEKLAQWVRPGVSAFLEVVLDSTAAPELAVPRSAIVQDGLVHVFFRRDPSDPNQAIRVEADMGVSDGRWVVLSSGVMRGDEVVLDGAYELKLALDRSGAAAASDGGHVHADGTSHADH